MADWLRTVATTTARMVVGTAIAAPVHPLGRLQIDPDAIRVDRLTTPTAPRPAQPGLLRFGEAIQDTLVI